MAQEKIKCLVNGKIKELSPAGFEMAKEYFGATLISDNIAEIPIELRKPLIIPKKRLEVIEKVPIPEEIKKPDVEVIIAPEAKEIPKTEPIEQAIPEIKKEVVAPVKKPVKRNPRKK
jgi:hypothetical protein